MVLLTINGTPCPNTIRETKALFASVGEGELTVMAVNVDRSSPTQTTTAVMNDNKVDLSSQTKEEFPQVAEPQQKHHHHRKDNSSMRSEEVMEMLKALAVSPSNSRSGMIFGNDSMEEEDGAVSEF